MNDLEIESLLQDAGYQLDLGAGGYVIAGTEAEEDFYSTQEVADVLEIPVEDLYRWETEQRHADEMAGG